MTNSCDVLVVGAGLAGLSAATRASELGLKVVVVEKGADEDYICNSRLTGGAFHIGMESMLEPPATILKNIETATRGHSRQDLADVVAHNSDRVISWLRTQGVRFIKGPLPNMSAMLSPPKLMQFGLHWKGRAGDVLLRTLADRVRERGGEIIRGAAARELVMTDGRCVGARVEHGGRTDTVSAGAVVVADGGFQANQEMVGKYISPAPEKVFQRNAGTGKGDGARMAEAVGARLVDMDCFYGHILHMDVYQNERLWPYPQIDAIAMAGMLVDRNGKRFVDEGLSGVYGANAIARLRDPWSVTVIFDDAIWNGPATGPILMPNPNVLVAGGHILEAQTLEDLAVKANVDAAGLVATVAAYNESIARGATTTLTPPRSTAIMPPFPIVKPPFRAIPVCSGITYTMGGIAIDGQARALDIQNRPIPGLFAAGGACGGLEGGKYIGYTGGLSKASIFGMLAAETIAAAKGLTVSDARRPAAS